MGAHLAALHYWCEKWHGSRDLAYSFAEAAAARAPKGSLLAAMPLFAVFEHLPEVNLVRGFYQSEVVTKAVHGALHAVHSARPDDPMQARPPSARLLPGPRRALGRAMNQLILIGRPRRCPALDPLPDPAAEFAVYRALAVAGYRGERRQPATLPTDGSATGGPAR